MRIYLDCCCLQRPFDDQTQPRIKVEAEAVLAILAAVEAGDAELLGSEALQFEINQTANRQRREEVLGLLSIAREQIELNESLVEFAEALEFGGIPSMDAVHVASAIQGQADCFATCDDRLRRRLAAWPDLPLKVVTPFELLLEITK